MGLAVSEHTHRAVICSLQTLLDMPSISNRDQGSGPAIEIIAALVHSHLFVATQTHMCSTSILYSASVNQISVKTEIRHGRLEFATEMTLTSLNNAKCPTSSGLGGLLHRTTQGRRPVPPGHSILIAFGIFLRKPATSLKHWQMVQAGIGVALGEHTDRLTATRG